MRTAPTPAHLRTTADGRPYFLWDTDLTWEEYEAKLVSADEDEAAYWLARGLRDAKPDDMVELVSFARIRQLWPRLERFLGRRRAFWAWWLERTGHAVDA